VTLRKENRLTAFENRMLRRIVRPRRDEVTGSWIDLNKEELDNLYSSPSLIIMIKIRKMKLALYVA
jgi:hypothetical protein